MPDVSPVLDGQPTPPRASVILPCRGVDSDLEACLESLVRQDHPDYELLLVTTEDDDSLPLLRRFAGEHPELSRVVVAPPTPPVRSQKLTNQLAALSEADPGSGLFVFVDSDIRPGVSFLGDLVGPLCDPEVGAATGFRWYVPEKGRWASYVRSAWNAAGMAFLQDEKVNYAWGGAMAIRRHDFERLDIASRWSMALSDDHTLTAAVRESGLKIRFVPKCLLPSTGDCTWRELEEWTTRQTKISRVYAPRFFWKTVRLHTVGLFVLATIIAGAAITGWWPAAVGLLSVALIVQLVPLTRALNLSESMLPGEARVRLAANRRMYYLAATAALVLYGVNVARALFSRRITWRGIIYEMVSPTDTVIKGL